MVEVVEGARNEEQYEISDEVVTLDVEVAAKSGKGGDDMTFGEDRKVDLPAGGDEGVVLDDND